MKFFIIILQLVAISMLPSVAMALNVGDTATREEFKNFLRNNLDIRYDVHAQWLYCDDIAMGMIESDYDTTMYSPELYETCMLKAKESIDRDLKLEGVKIIRHPPTVENIEEMTKHIPIGDVIITALERIGANGLEGDIYLLTFIKVKPANPDPDDPKAYTLYIHWNIRHDDAVVGNYYHVIIEPYNYGPAFVKASTEHN